MKKHIVILATIVILGLFLRIYNLADKELWYDEAFSAEIISNNYIELYKLSALDVHPPLYYLVLKLFTSIFGNSEISLRSPSIIFGVAFIVLAYKLTLYMTQNINRGLFVALVVSVNPFLVIYSREARSYSMLAFLTVLSFYLAIRAFRENKYLAVSFVLPLLFLTHYISLFIIFIYMVIMLVHSKRNLLYLLPLMVIILFWIPIMFSSSKSTGLTWIPQFTVIRVPESVHAFFLGTDTNEPRVAPPLNPFPINNTFLSICIFIFITFSIVFSKPSGEKKLILICSVIPMILIAITSTFFGINFYVERFMIGYGALLLVYFAIITPRLYILSPYILLCIYIILTLKPTNIGYRELAKYKFDRPIVMSDAGDFINAKYYVKEIKLHDGNWKQWIIIHPDDIYNEKVIDGDFYLVNRGPLENWQPKLIVGEFYLYDWNVDQELILK